MARKQTTDIGGEVFAIMTPERARALEALARAVTGAPYFHDGRERNCLICRAIARLSRVSRKKGDRNGK
jgi:L-asparaginase II